jgi:D-xylose transport system substrate-binding protein
MEQALTAIGEDRLAGVYSANDGMAGGAIAALKGGGVDPSSIPVTGGDAEVAALQRILAGEQHATIYLTIRKQAEVSAQIAVAAARGEEPPAGLLNAKVDNGSGKVPSVLLTPVVVTRDNIAGTVIEDGFYEPSEICGGSFARPCEEAGIG